MVKQDFVGLNGFVWWVGVVEDRKDPIKLGRCRVRIVGWHTENKMKLPTENLPWAQILLPTNNTNTYVPKEGDTVIGFFVDADAAQQPVIMGVVPGIPIAEGNPQQAFNDPRVDRELQNAPRTPLSKSYVTDGSGISITEKDQSENYPKIVDEPTTSRIARNDSESIGETFIQERKDNVVNSVPTFNSSWSEPTTNYNAVYPYNNVYESESGHIMEFDDTPGAERVHLAHRNGSFQEMFPDGDKVEKITKDNYQIVMKNNHVYIMGKCNITVQGDAEIYVQQNAYAKVDGNATVDIGGNVDVTVGGNYNEQVSGTYTVQSGGNMKFTAPRIDLNP